MSNPATPEKNKGGQPRLLESPEKAQELIDAYFDKIKKYNENPVNKSNGDFEIPTVEDLALALGLNSRQTLFNYESYEGFFDTIKKAKTRILAEHKKLALKGKMNAAIAIFNWKNNFGYKDKTEVDSNHTTLDENGNKKGMDITINFTGE